MIAMRKIASAFVLAAAVAAPAFAQSQDDSIVIQINAGSPMVSTGGDFATAFSGQPVEAGWKVMIPQRAAATLVYKNGCKRELRQPGVYTIPRDCSYCGLVGVGHAPGVNAAIVAGVAALGAAVLLNEKDEKVGPLSASIRHF
jgi:hypothetical protein